MFKNWKTTVVGIGCGFANLWANGLTVKQAGLSVLVALLGALAKDFDKSHTQP